jgi:hypothetical protein
MAACAPFEPAAWLHCTPVRCAWSGEVRDSGNGMARRWRTKCERQSSLLPVLCAVVLLFAVRRPPFHCPLPHRKGPQTGSQPRHSSSSFSRPCLPLPCPSASYHLPRASLALLRPLSQWSWRGFSLARADWLPVRSCWQRGRDQPRAGERSAWPPQKRLRWALLRSESNAFIVVETG